MLRRKQMYLKQKVGNVENANEILQESSDESFENWFNSIKESQATELKLQDVHRCNF